MTQAYAAGWGTAYAGAPAIRRADPAQLQSLAGETMGTTWSCRLLNPAMRPLAELQAIVEGALAQVVQQMSTWEPASDIVRFNAAPAGQWVRVPPEFATVLRRALHWAQASHGACDPTVGPLVSLWGFGPRAANGAGREAPPAQAAIERARASVGWQRLALDEARGTVLQPGGAELDFSGIAKGFAVDQVLQALSAAGLADLLVEVGGELRGQGARPGGVPWRVALPTLAGEGARSVALGGRAIATSGDAYHAFTHAGRRFSHTLDPRTGWPVDDAVASVTVVQAHCVDADALATALAVLGPAAGLDFARRHGVAATWLLRTPGGERRQSTPAFEALAGWH